MQGVSMLARTIQHRHIVIFVFSSSGHGFLPLGFPIPKARMREGLRFVLLTVLVFLSMLILLDSLNLALLLIIERMHPLSTRSIFHTTEVLYTSKPITSHTIL